jgi:hypothetical protein
MIGLALLLVVEQVHRRSVITSHFALGLTEKDE